MKERSETVDLFEAGLNDGWDFVAGPLLIPLPPPKNAFPFPPTEKKGGPCLSTSHSNPNLPIETFVPVANHAD
jgi:hypothetical protein